MVIGHNPGLHQLVLDLVAGDGEQELAAMRAKFPTAALATLLVPAAGWADLRAGGAELSSFVVPRALPSS
jgi:phosphohistidine phosphatase